MEQKLAPTDQTAKNTSGLRNNNDYIYELNFLTQIIEPKLAPPDQTARETRKRGLLQPAKPLAVLVVC